LLLDKPRLTKMGQAARQVVEDNQGALQVSLDQIAAFLADSAASAGATAGGLHVTLSSSRS
jgi:hypothetical protein